MVYLVASYAFTRRCGGHVGKRLGGAAMKETTSALGATARVIEIVRSGASRYVEFAFVSTGAVNIAFQRAVSVTVDVLLLEIAAENKFD